MGLFGGSKSKEPHVCYCCGREYSGIFSGMKVGESDYICMKCFPDETDLMRVSKKRKTLNPEFDVYALSRSRRAMDQFIRFKEKNEQRTAQFKADEAFFKGKLLVDHQNLWFKLKEYEEIFPLQQISSLDVLLEEGDRPFRGRMVIMLDHWIYMCVTVDFEFQGKSFWGRDRRTEFVTYLNSVHRSLRPDVTLSVL